MSERIASTVMSRTFSGLSGRPFGALATAAAELAAGAEAPLPAGFALGGAVAEEWVFL